MQTTSRRFIEQVGCTRRFIAARDPQRYADRKKTKRFTFIAVMLMIFGGCSPQTDTVSADARSLNIDWWSKGGKNESRLICEIKTLPKATFLEIVTNSSALTQEDKRIVADVISPDVYTHATLQKAEYWNTRFLVIDQFYPERIVGKDNEDREIVEGGVRLFRIDCHRQHERASKFYYSL